MALKIRLRAQGRKNRTFYRLVVADSRYPRDGKYVEMLGWYNPFQPGTESNIEVKMDRLEHWLKHGAQMTPKLETLVKRVNPAFIKGFYKERLDRELAKRAKKKAEKVA